jgi:nucleotide-binding universal stress UspA family protein
MVALETLDTVLTNEKEEATAYLEAVRMQLSARGLPVRTELVTGDVAAALLAYEERAGIDLAVICSHGRSGLARVVLGSVAKRLARHGRGPLLLVRACGSMPDLTRAVVPLDGSSRAEAALGLVENLAPKVVTTITLLTAIPSAAGRRAAERYLAGVAGRLCHTGAIIRTHIEVGHPVEVIKAVAGTEQVVMMATHGRSGIARCVLGSVTARVIHGGVSAVLLVRVPS